MIHKSNSIKFNTFAYYISQFSWIMYILVPFLVSLLFPKRTNKIIISSSSSLFNNSIDPIIFAHISDTHINSLRPESIKSFRKTFSHIKKISPEFVVLTGDIVDNYDSISFPRYGEQDEKNWKIYKEETKNFDDIPIIEAFGNHDMFGVKNIYSSKNYFLDYSHSFNRNNTKNIDEFSVHSFPITKSQANIISINPFDFPTPHPPLLLYKKFSNRLLNLLEKEISMSQSYNNIVICHYPVGSIHSQKSNFDLEFNDIIGSKNLVNVYLSGHSHPENPQIFHHGNGGIEILGVSSYKNSRFGLISIDNKGVSMQTIDNENNQNGIITYPISQKYISSNTIFNDINTSEIRVVIFSGQKNLSIFFSISNLSNSKIIFSGMLNFSRSLKNGYSLYSFPMSKCISHNGSYNITFSGDFNGYREFFIMNEVEVGGEKLTEYPRIVDMLLYLFPIFILILLTITIIIPFDCSLCHKYQDQINNIEEWIETTNGNEEDKVKNWLITCFCGFILIRNRFQKSPIAFKLFALFSVIYVFIGPLLFFKTEDYLGYVWMYGYFIDNKIIHSDYGVFYSYFYLGIVCTPMILLISSIGVKSWFKYQIGDIIFATAALIGDIIVLIRIVHQTSGSKLTGLSIGFVFIPFVYIMLFIIYIISKLNRDKHDKNDGIVDINDSNASSQQIQ